MNTIKRVPRGTTNLSELALSHSFYGLSAGDETERVRTALTFIPADDRDEWWRVVASVKSVLGLAGRDIAETYSQKSDSFNPRDFNDVWNSCKPGNGITGGTLFHLARQYGYQPERSSISQRDTADRIRSEAARRDGVRIDTRSAAAEKQANQIKAAATAERLWNQSGPVTDHPYLVRKDIPSLNSRLFRAMLHIPLVDTENRLWNLQQIYQNGTKLWLAGGRITGLFSLIGADALPNSGTVFITEGWATAATVYMMQNAPVVAAMTAGNLASVAQNIATARPKLNLVIAADDDRQTQGNPGRLKALAAAQQIGAGVIFPSLCDQCACTDFNDVQTRCRRVSV